MMKISCFKQLLNHTIEQKKSFIHAQKWELMKFKLIKSPYKTEKKRNPII